MKTIFSCLLLALTAFAQAEPKWRHIIKTDPMTDAITCSVQAVTVETPSPIFLFSSAGTSIGAFGSDFPNREIAFRVDSNKAITGKEFVTGHAAKLLLSQLEEGKALKVSAYKWPKDYPVLAQHEILDLPESIAACKAALK
jgi:hypothetical protein